MKDDRIVEVKIDQELIDRSKAAGERKPFPYWPPVVSNEELIRMEVMMELNKWANNEPELAKRSAATLITLLSKQFGIDLKDIK